MFRWHKYLWQQQWLFLPRVLGESSNTKPNLFVVSLKKSSWVQPLSLGMDNLPWLLEQHSNTQDWSYWLCHEGTMTCAVTVKYGKLKVHLHLQGFVRKNTNNNSGCSYLGSLFNEMTHRIDQISCVTLGAYTSTAAVSGYRELKVHLQWQGFFNKNTNNNSGCTYLGSMYSATTHRNDHISCCVTQRAWPSTVPVTGYGKLRLIYIGKVLSAKRQPLQ